MNSALYAIAPVQFRYLMIPTQMLYNTGVSYEPPDCVASNDLQEHIVY